MREQMDRLFDNSFGRFRQTPGLMDRDQEWLFAPRIDVREETDQYVVRIDVPGADKSDLSVNIEGRLLTVTGQINTTVDQNDGNYMLRKERRSGRFQRSLTLPGPVKTDEMQAQYQDGVLTVTVPKNEVPEQARTINVI
jgi:HSP20 family protein